MQRTRRSEPESNRRTPQQRWPPQYVFSFGPAAWRSAFAGALLRVMPLATGEHFMSRLIEQFLSWAHRGFVRALCVGCVFAQDYQAPDSSCFGVRALATETRRIAHAEGATESRGTERGVCESGTNCWIRSASD